MASKVGLLAIRPPSRNRPKARKYDGAAPLALAACQTNCWQGGGGGDRRFSIERIIKINMYSQSKYLSVMTYDLV